MSTPDILWQGWLLSTGKSQSDWKKRYFLFTSKQLSYHDAPNTAPKGIFEYANTSSICWLSEGINYCKQQTLFARGQGSAPVLSSGDSPNIFLLFTNTAIIQIGCLKEQIPTLRQVLKYKFRPCSVIGACEFYRKKNKFQWTKNYVTILSSRDIVVFENEKLDAIVSRIPLDGIECQFVQGTEANYKNILEIRYGDKSLILSTGSTPQSQQQCQELYHIAFFASTGCHPAFPPPNGIAWNLPLLTAYSNGFFTKGVFEREAIYQGIQEEIRPWIWKQLSEQLLKDSVVLGVEDIEKLAMGISHIPAQWNTLIEETTSQPEEQELLRLICKYPFEKWLFRIFHIYPELKSINTMCPLALYLIKSLPVDVALTVFQTLLQVFLPLWLRDNLFQQIETSVFTHVCSQLNADLMEWSRSRQVNWTPVLREWIQSMFISMNRQSVNRIWSIMLFEGYGSLLPLIISLLTSNKQMIMSLSPSTDVQSFLEKEFLPKVSNISDVTRNFRILTAANQPTYQLFEINTIRNLRLKLLQNVIKDIQLVSMSAKKKSGLVENQTRSNAKYRAVIDNLIKTVSHQLDDIKETSKNDPDVRTQYNRLQRIVELFTECLQPIHNLEACIKHYTILLNNRNLVVLDVIDTMSTITNNQTCLPDTNQVSAICRNFEESKMNITLMQQRADIISILMAAQTCVWKLISVAWEIHEMHLRKVQNEMCWMMSNEVMETIHTKTDYMTQTYTNALRIAQVCAEDVLKYIRTTHDDLFSTYCSASVPATKVVYEELQKKWDEKSEEKLLTEEFTELTKHTGFKST